MKNKVFACMLLFFLLGSCAPKQEIKPVEAPPPQPVAEQPAPPPEVPPASKQPESPQETKQPEQYVMLNFVNADIDNVISTVGEMLKINYILAPGVTGKITIQSHNKIPLSQLFSTFQTLLETNGFTAVKDGEFYKIVPIDIAKQQSVPVVEGKTPTVSKDSSFITQEIPLTYVKASDVANIMRNLMPRGTDIVAYEPSNMLIVTATPSAMLKLLKILEAIDIAPSEREAIRTFVYYVENGEAKKLVEILKTLYASKKEEGKTVTPTTPAAAAARQLRPGQAPAAPAPTPSAPVVLEGLPGEIQGPVVIDAYEDINAIVIKTTPAGYISLLQTIKKLDVQPKQVLIEVMIAEVSLDKTTQFGLEWLLKGNFDINNQKIGIVGGFNTAANAGYLPQFNTSQNQFVIPSTGSSSSTTGGTILSHPSDVFATILNPDKFSALITASASKGLVHILASPNILALDNKEAKIEIGNEVPVATSITQPLAGATTTEITATSQVQFKTVGTILTVTPHINAQKQVTLKISQEQSAIGSTVLIGGQPYTGFITRKANTTAIVQDGHTLIIGGIIQEVNTQSREGIPFLSDIPVLGYLFGDSSDHVTRNELVVMVTPHVISNAEEADELTREVRSRVRELNKKLKENDAQLKENIQEEKEETTTQ
jgi:general secretion pathway protein D